MPTLDSHSFHLLYIRLYPKFQSRLSGVRASSAQACFPSRRAREKTVPEKDNAEGPPALGSEGLCSGNSQIIKGVLLC